MAIDVDLTPYSSIKTETLCILGINNYRVELTDFPEDRNFFFSDSQQAIRTSNDVVFEPIGKLMLTEYGSSNLKTNDDNIAVTLSGIPNSSVREILNSDIKGSTVGILRAFFDPVTGEPLPVRSGAGNIAARFTGYVNTYTVAENFDVLDLDGTTTLILECLSTTTVFKRVVNGIRTNPEDLRAVPIVDADTGEPLTDISFDRIPNLVGSTYDFGAARR